MRKVKIKGWIVYLLVIFLILISGCGRPAGTGAGESTEQAEDQPATEPIVFTFAHGAVPGTFAAVGYDMFAEAIAEESKGQIKVEVYPAGSLIGDPQVLDAIRLGNVDMAHCVIPYLSPTIKELTPLEIPGAFPGDKYKELAKATQSVLEKIFEKYDIKYLCPNNQSTVAFASVTKLIKSPEDFKGLTIRTPGKWGGKAIELWGGSPLTIPLGDVPIALERKTVDVNYGGWNITEGFRLYESAPNITFTSLQENFAPVMMSKKSWDKLSEEQQQAVLRAAARHIENADKLTSEAKAAFINKLEEMENVNVYHLSDSENAEFAKVVDILMEEVKEICGPEGLELMEALKTLK
jgi:TRAP-type C4-dicarboxylate transport system substrate-binding protein